MKYWGIFLVFLLFSCGQDYNSNSFDEQKYNTKIETDSPEGLRFYNAYNVINSKCISCHTSYHNGYANYTTSEKWIESGLVTANDFENSFLILKLKNYGGSMPQGGSELSSEQITYLKDWIEGL